MSKKNKHTQIEQPALILALLRSTMSRYLSSLVLWLLLIISAFSLLFLSHQQRLMYAKLEALNKGRDELDVEWRQLRLEQRVLAEHSRLEEVATERLGMKSLDLKSERIVKQVKDGE